MRAPTVLVLGLLVGCDESAATPPRPTTAPTEIAPAAPPSDAVRAPDFAAYPAEPMTGGPRMPDFDAAPSELATQRARLTEGAAAGPNFAGHYAIVEIGCGVGCNDPYVVDLTTGRIVDLTERLPDGLVRLAYRVDSALLQTTVRVSGVGDWHEDFVVRDGQLWSMASGAENSACP